MATDSAAPSFDDSSFLSQVLPKELLNLGFLARVKAWPAEFRVTLVSVLLATTVFVPYLGAVGLWDPWETHYGEVAREMIQRNDYVHPYWENAWFFSKPAFTMWMMALGMQAARGGALTALVLAALFGGLGAYAFSRSRKGEEPKFEFFAALAGVPALLFALLGVWGLVSKVPWKLADIPAGDGALPLFTEWAFRMPFTSFSIMAVGLLSYAMARLVNPRAALATAFVLCTMPLYFLISRQAVTDTPIVAATISGISCALVALYDRQSPHRAEWWYASYVFFGIATVAKGLLGFGIPMVIFFALVALTITSAKDLSETVMWLTTKGAVPLAMGVGVGLIAAVIASTLGQQADTMFMAPQLDQTKPPPLSAAGWLGVMWGSLAFWIAATVMFGRVSKRLTDTPPAIIRTAYEMKLGTGILVFLAVALPWYYEMFTFWRVDDESKLFWFRFIVHDHFARLGAGVHTTTPGGNFTYFIEQGGYAMYPWVVLIPGAFAAVSKLKLRSGEGADGVGVVAVLWFAVTWGLIGASATKFHHYVFPMLPPLAVLMGLFIDRVWREGIEAHSVVLLLGLPILFLVGKDLSGTPKNFTDLFVYNYDRPYPAFLTEQPAWQGATVTVKSLMGMAFALFGGAATIFLLSRNKAAVFGTVLAGGLTWAIWFNWFHWVDLSHHWTQRDQFWRYFSQRRPGEPIAAFLMNWRGETFYSRNEVKQIKDNANVGMANYAQLPGRKWSLVEHARLGILKGVASQVGKNVTLIDKDLNNKFVLVTIE